MQTLHIIITSFVESIISTNISWPAKIYLKIILKMVYWKLKVPQKDPKLFIFLNFINLVDFAY